MADEPNETPGRSTLGIHAGRKEPKVGEPVAAPLIQSSTFYGWGPEGGERRYGRMGNNPTVEAVQRTIAALEGTESALLLSSGMAATALGVLSRLEHGEHMVSSQYLYGGTWALFTEELPRRGVEITFVNPDDEGSWADALRPETKVVYLEIPTNPTLRIFDPAPVAEAAREAGAAFLVDATFASPVNLRMVEHGADLVIHSATKYLGGHSDLLAGVVAGSRQHVEEVRRLMVRYGPSADPNSAWLLDRSLRTLELRVERQNENALDLARWLEGRDEVREVIYPGLPGHPDHERASRLLDGFGGMLSMVLEGGGEAADRFMGALETALVAPSLGGVETLVSQPRYTSHLDMTPKERNAVGIPDGFVRVSVGVENVADLKRDFQRALTAG
ncbi:MAG: aminotransferase class I/II-fold pyridoxal phosphate-dependent enzyme [Longimicrobiales bacterium]|nr:aminotransferase class I/II-fold pyridoxal phosphate-dependent enzyme [Longimicrobiales bacterium]